MMATFVTLKVGPSTGLSDGAISLVLSAPVRPYICELRAVTTENVSASTLGVSLSQLSSSGATSVVGGATSKPRSDVISLCVPALTASTRTEVNRLVCSNTRSPFPVTELEVRVVDWSTGNVPTFDNLFIELVVWESPAAAPPTSTSSLGRGEALA